MSTPTPPPTDGPPTFDELQLAGRNRSLPLEALRYDITPTGLHYLLIHFDIPDLDAATWRLSVGGNVERPSTLSIDEIRSLPARTLPVTMECAGNGRAKLRPRPISNPWLDGAVGTARWTGTPLGAVLERARIKDGTVELVFTGADAGVEKGHEHVYARSLRLDDALRDEVLLVYDMNGEPLPPQHGAPLRLLVPGWYGMTSVKWLVSIEAVTEPFEGYQQGVAYRYLRDADDAGEPVTRIKVRSLMLPPGRPDYLTRARTLDAGRTTIRGRAWAGAVPIPRVEFGIDGTWYDAVLGEQVGEFAWRSWSFEWDATPGEWEISCRATDANGNTQPLEQAWNYQGMGNNMAQRVTVTVR